MAIECVTKILNENMNPRTTIQRNRNVNSDENDRRRMALKHLADSEFGRASQALDRGGLRTITADTRNAVEELYPPSEFIAGQYVGGDFEQPIQVTEEDVKAALKRMKASAPGLSRIDSKMIKEIMFADPKLTECFLRVINIILGGKDGCDDPRLKILIGARGERAKVL